MLFSLRRFHLERIIEAIEVIKQADRGSELNDFTLSEMAPQLREKLILDVVGIHGEPFGKTQCGLFGGGKIATLLEFCEVLDLILRPAQPFCQKGVRCQSILTVVELGSPYDQEFLELGGNRASVHDGAQVCNHGAEDFRPVGGRAEHVGHVATLFLIDLENLAGFRIDLVFGEP